MANYPQLDDQVGVWKLKEVNDAVMGGYWRNVGSRAFHGGGHGPVQTRHIETANMSSSGNTTLFGDLLTLGGFRGSCGNFTRGLWAGGYTPSVVNNIDYITFTTEGNLILLED